MKKALLVFLLIVTVLGIIGYRMWNKPHSDMTSATPDAKLTATELYKVYQTNETMADKQYLGKVILVTGNILEVNQGTDGSTNLLLDTGDPMSTILCQLDKFTKQTNITYSAGQQVTVKGICSGFTGDVVIDRCIVTDKK